VTSRSDMKVILVFAVALVAVHGAKEENFVFETIMAGLVIGSDGLANSLINNRNHKEELRPGPFTAVRKGGRLLAASALEPPLRFAPCSVRASAVSADYRITALAEYLVVELVRIQGDGVEEIRLMELNTPSANEGRLLGVRWDNEFAICLMGLSDQVDSKVIGLATASVYPEFSMQGQRVVIIAAPTLHFLEVVEKVQHDFQLPSPKIGDAWAKRSTSTLARGLRRWDLTRSTSRTFLTERPG
jgi:hypothetical protein